MTKLLIALIIACLPLSSVLANTTKGVGCKKGVHSAYVSKSTGGFVLHIPKAKLQSSMPKLAKALKTLFTPAQLAKAKAIVYDSHSKTIVLLGGDKTIKKSFNCCHYSKHCGGCCCGGFCCFDPKHKCKEHCG